MLGFAALSPAVEIRCPSYNQPYSAIDSGSPSPTMK